MKDNLLNIVNILKTTNKTISTMESCTGGYLANCITNIEGASNVYQFSAITYSTDYKIKMGVDKKIIEKYSVYSKETADEMAYKIALYTNSNYGVGITGKLNNDEENKGYFVYYTIYNQDNNQYYSKYLKLENIMRERNKKLIVNKIVEDLLIILSKNNK
ncbi:MAG: CinA family protein [Bacilli bacterium]